MRLSIFAPLGLVLGYTSANPGGPPVALAQRTNIATSGSSSGSGSSLPTTAPSCNTADPCYSAFKTHPKTMSSVCAGISTQSAAPSGFGPYCPGFSLAISSVCSCLMPVTFLPSSTSNTSSSSNSTTSIPSATLSTSSSTTRSSSSANSKSNTTPTPSKQTSSAAASTTCLWVFPTNEPSDLNCGVFGTLPAEYNSNTILGASGQTVNDCQNLCKATRSCLVFGYSNQTSQCTLYAFSLDAMQLKQTTSGNITYYNSNCFVQSCLTISMTATQSSTFTPGSSTTNATLGASSTAPTTTAAPQTAFNTTSTTATSQTVFNTTSTHLATSTISVVTTSSTTSSAPVNLVTAGDFEDGSWGGWIQTAAFGNETYGVSSPGYLSNYAGYLYASESFGEAMQYNSSMGMFTQGMLYNFSMYFMTDNPSCWMLGANGQNILFYPGLDDTNITADTWSFYTGSFVYNTAFDEYFDNTWMNGDFYLAIEYGCNSGTGTGYFDDIQLLSAGPTINSANSPATGANLFAEPNFDSGTPGNWSAYAGALSIASPGYDGAEYAAVFEIYPGEAASFYVNVNTIQDEVYLFSFAYMVKKGGESDECTLDMYTEDVTGNIAQWVLQIYHGGLAAAGEWALLQGVATAPVSDAQLVIMINCGYSPTSFYVGDMQVVPLS